MIPSFIDVHRFGEILVICLLRGGFSSSALMCRFGLLILFHSSLAASSRCNSYRKMFKRTGSQAVGVDFAAPLLPNNFHSFVPLL